MSQTYESFGKYILLEKIQTGGMAEIYLARKPGASGVSKFLAIKRILPQYSEQSDFIEMFKDEAKIAVNLAHANIVSIHEFGMERNTFFIAMDFVEGRNLRQILNKMKKSGVSFSIEQVLYIIKEVASGLDHAHRCIDANTGKPLNIIHRDMSPQNVMVSFEGEIKIVDFGIAKAETQIDSTRAGTLKGKFSYMSPEQAEGQIVDLRTDVFALGIVLWELLANDRLFVANNEMNTLRKVRDCQIPSLRKINPNIPQELERIVSKALSKDKNLRYQTAAAFHRELSRFLNRQFPDFSQHDFSVFVKTLFAAEILENRKKMVEYARIELNQNPSEAKNDATTVLDSTSTENTFGPRSEPPPRPTPPPRRSQRPSIPTISPSSNSINTSNLSVDRSVYRDRDSSVSRIGSSSSGTYYGTRTGSDVRPVPSRLSASFLPLTMILIGSMVGASVLFPTHFKRVQYQVAKLMKSEDPTQEPKGEVTNASRSEASTFSVRIESVPSGAEILINGTPAGDVTPTTVQVTRGIDAKITVRKPGYQVFEQIERIDSNKSLSLNLQPERFGKVDINVVGSGQIFINGKLIASGSPANDIIVPADQELVIRAEDPSTKAWDEMRVRVSENSTRKITLIPRHNKKP